MNRHTPRMIPVRNVIFVIVHDIGTELGCYGKPVVSPNLDRFASRGVRFANAFTNSPCCTPSRCCLMTGKYAHVSGGIGLAHQGWPLPPGQRTVVDAFNDAGIETAHFGSSHERHAGENHYRIDEECNWDDVEASAAVDKAIPYLDARARSNNRFYLNIGISSTHDSHYSRRYAPDQGGGLSAAEAHVPLFVADTPAMRSRYGMFGASLKYMDEEVGRLFDAIERLGLFENTLVIFTTDHGIMGPRSKGSLYDRGVETALLMRGPGIAAGTVVENLVPNIDLAPTVLEAMGVSVSDDMQGRSLWPMLTGVAYRPHEAIFTERNFHCEQQADDGSMRDLYDPTRAIRTEQFHYIRRLKPDARPRCHSDRLPWETIQYEAQVAADPGAGSVLPGVRPSEELYDIHQDPLEFVDLAGKPEYAAVKRDLAERLDAWMRQTNDFALTGRTPARYEEPTWGHNWPRNDDEFRFCPETEEAVR